MKKIMFLLIITHYLAYSAFSQTVNDVQISEIDVEYVEIVGTSKFLSSKVTIEIHFGQQDKLWSGSDTQLRDEEGKRIDFNSMIDALNFMSKHGYEFKTAYAVSSGNNQSVYHYLLRKKSSEKPK